MRVDHDISLLIPEIWWRLSPAERDPTFLIARADTWSRSTTSTTPAGTCWPAGWATASPPSSSTTSSAASSTTRRVFDEAILRPETQDLEAFVDGDSQHHRGPAAAWRSSIEDGSIDDACPPLAAIVRLMADDPQAGPRLDASARDLFTRESLLQSDWYQQRLAAKQQQDISLAERNVAYLGSIRLARSHRDVARRMNIEERLNIARQQLRRRKALTISIASAAPSVHIRSCCPLHGQPRARPIGHGITLKVISRAYVTHSSAGGSFIRVWEQIIAVNTCRLFVGRGNSAGATIAKMCCLRRERRIMGLPCWA